MMQFKLDQIAGVLPEHIAKPRTDYQDDIAERLEKQLAEARKHPGKRLKNVPVSKHFSKRRR